MKINVLSAIGTMLLSASVYGAESQELNIEKGAPESKWKLIDYSASKTGKVLTGDNESALITFEIKESGAHKIWVKFHTEKDKIANLMVLVRSKEGEGIRCERVDYIQILSKCKPYLKYNTARPAGARWHVFELQFEYPGEYTLNFGNLPAEKGISSKKIIESVFISNDPAFNPEKELKPSLSSNRTLAAVVPAGFKPATPYSLNSSVFCGIKNPDKRYKAGIIQCGSIYYDPATMVLLGVAYDQHYLSDPKYGIRTMVSVKDVNKNSDEFKKNNPSSTGRFINAEGKTGSDYSLAYDKAAVDVLSTVRSVLTQKLNDKYSESIDAWSVAGEFGGRLDYSKESIEKFREWLSHKYSNIESLNKEWQSAFKSFSEISPPKSIKEGKPAWLEFREFCGSLVADAIARSVDMVNAADPLKRPATTQLSNSDLLTARSLSTRPVDFEELILKGLKNTDNVSWDAYGADDFMGAEVDLIDSLGQGKKMTQREFNTHTPDPRIAARSYWTMVGKGVKGISLLHLQEGGLHDSYPKWALSNTDLSPRPKLAAFSDAMHEIHRIENILVEAKKVYPVKPVAIYYSRIDNSLQKYPLLTVWSESANSPYHVYEMLRGRGYPVTWITSRQINEGKLKEVAAVILVDAEHIPRNTSERIVEWVKTGGVLIGDTWPGAYDALGNRQNALLKLFGVSPRERKRVDSIKLEESTQGYGEVTIAAINPDKLYETVMETWQQWDSTHPVAKAMGNYMFSGYGAKDITCDAGEVVGMVFDGHPGVVINQTGKGQSMYISTMLGSLFGGSATRYEWDFAHSDLSPAKLIDSFLNFAGVKKLSDVDLPERMAFKIRVEAPLVDSTGNAIIAVTSYNDVFLKPFDLKFAWSANIKVPKKIFAAVGSKRTLEDIPFKVNNGKIEFKMPSFDSHATLIAINKSVPLVAIDFGTHPRGEAGIVSMTPGQTLNGKVTVYNVTGEKIDGGKLKLRLHQGWFCDKEIIDLPSVAPWEKVNAEFNIKAPAFCAATRIRPISVVFESKNTASMPCTEMVWWKEK